MKNKINLVTASAGSGKTHKLQETLAQYVDPKNKHKIRPEGVIATTFTKKAAVELKERARQALIKKEYFDEAIRLEGALISTVHSVCTKIIEMFSYKSGLSPKLEVIPEDDQTIYFNNALSSVLTEDITNKMNHLVYKLHVKDFEYPYDWRDDVRDVMDAARSNGIDSQGLLISLENSWTELQKTLGPVLSAEAIESEVITEGARVLSELKLMPKLGKLDEGFIQKLSEFLRNLDDGRDIIWDKWQSIAGAKLNNPGEAIASSYQGIVAGYISHPKFHEEYKQFLDIVFTTAANALEKYQDYKRERGLIDYSDMESLVMNLLGDSEVQQRISEDFDLLMVDEFQDTNPMQLGIFLKLSKIIPNVIWVGDQKQSIYGFRGADPSLFESILANMKDDIQLESLSNSYRSRPHLVKHANSLFLEAFKGILPPDQVKLDPKRVEKTEYSEAFEVWRITKTGKQHSNEKSMRAVAKQIKDMLESKRIVSEKKGDEEITREATFKDIAILCNSNKKCINMASYLKELGLPVSLEQVGLLALPESKLIMAALRYFAFPHDSLAVMEIKLLVDGKDNVEELIEERVKAVFDGNEKELNKDHWFIKRIDELRGIALSLSPYEVISHMLVKLELQRVTSSWGEGEGRWENLIGFRKNAKTYEDSCRRLKTGATLGGFMLWLEDREKNKLLTYGGSIGNAITVMTWHKSKGLEWPIVVLNDCAREVRKGAFGLRVISLEKELDIDNPLKGRILRFWFNPFQKSKKDFPFMNHVNDSDYGLEVAEKSVKEAARLLYVGITRARDYLIVPLNASDEAEQFTEVLGKSGSIDLPKDSGLQNLPWAHPDDPQVMVKIFIDIDQAPALIPSGSLVSTHKSSTGASSFEPYSINPSSQEELNGSTATLFGTYGKRLTVKTKVDDDKFGDCLHDIAAIPNLSKEDVERILLNYNLHTVLVADEIIEQMKQYEAFMNGTGLKNIQREVPVTAKINGKLATGIIDQLMEDDKGYCLIDHKSYQGTNLETKAQSFSGQLELYKKVIELGDKKVKSILVHFISQGIIYEIK
jgi:ATP-dependent helicase/nuclease subunit A